MSRSPLTKSTTLYEKLEKILSARSFLKVLSSSKRRSAVNILENEVRRYVKERADGKRRSVTGKEFQTILQHSLLNTLDRYYKYLFGEKGYSSHTIRAYLNDVLEFLEFIQKEELRLEELELRNIRAYFMVLTGAKLLTTGKSPDQRKYSGESGTRRISPRSQARKLASLRTYFRVLIRAGILQENPAVEIPTPRYFQALPGVIRPDDMEHLFDEVQMPKDRFQESEIDREESLRDLAIYEMLYSSGMRIGELLSLKITTFSISPAIKIMGKGGKERIVFLGDPAREAMGRYLEVREEFKPSTDSLFVNRKGTPMDDRTVRRRMEIMGKKLGMGRRLNPHRFRHTFATDLLNGGADIRAVQEMLGHATLSTTQIYTSVSKERLRDIHRQCHPHGKI